MLLGSRLAVNSHTKNIPVIPGGVAVEYCEKDANQSLTINDMITAAHNNGGVRIEIDMAPTRYIGSSAGQHSLIAYRSSEPMWAYNGAGWKTSYWGAAVGTPPPLNVGLCFGRMSQTMVMEKKQFLHTMLLKLVL